MAQAQFLVSVMTLLCHGLGSFSSCCAEHISKVALRPHWRGEERAQVSPLSWGTLVDLCWGPGPASPFLPHLPLEQPWTGREQAGSSHAGTEPLLPSSSLQDQTLPQQAQHREGVCTHPGVPGDSQAWKRGSGHQPHHTPFLAVQLWPAPVSDPGRHPAPASSLFIYYQRL